MWQRLKRLRKSFDSQALLIGFTPPAAILIMGFQDNIKATPAETKKVVSIYAARGPRMAMEDRWFVSSDFKFFAVYDGHGGARVAEHAQRSLYSEFMKELEGDGSNSKSEDTSRASESGLDSTKVKAALIKGFETVSDRILSIPSLDVEGSTAVIVYLCGELIVSANLGDSRAILCRGSKAIPLTVDHKPDSPGEKKRVEELGGKVQWHGYLGPDRLPVPGMGAYRINGNLAVSRALGDRLERPFVSSVPDINIINRKKEEDRFIVIASDGLWDVMTSQDVVDFVKQIMVTNASPATSRPKGKAVLPNSFSSSSLSLKKSDDFRKEMDKRMENMAQFLVEEALRRGSADNVTTIVVWL